MTDYHVGECDCCGKQRSTLRRVWPFGIETYACAACRHDDEEAEAAYEYLETEE